MSQFDVLNADVSWSKNLDDAIGPDFGWQRLRQSQLTTAKAAGGQPFYRTVGNAGHTTQFSWLNRSQKLATFLKQWAEAHEDGFFTIVDQDGGGRHYVGTFTGELPVVEAGNDRYNLQGWTFVETPGAPMLQYPDAWELWSVMERPWNDFGNLRTAFSGNWVRGASYIDDDGVSKTPNTLQNATPAIGDSITHEYRGYGFRLWCNQGPTYGSVNVLLDGVSLGISNLYDGGEDGPQVILTKSDVPLGIHRVQVVVSSNLVAPTDGTAAPSTPGAVIYTALEVMR